jgi:hypothetical protein
MFKNSLIEEMESHVELAAKVTAKPRWETASFRVALMAVFILAIAKASKKGLK